MVAVLDPRQLPIEESERDRLAVRVLFARRDRRRDRFAAMAARAFQRAPCLSVCFRVHSVLRVRVGWLLILIGQQARRETAIPFCDYPQTFAVFRSRVSAHQSVAVF